MNAMMGAIIEFTHVDHYHHEAGDESQIIPEDDTVSFCFHAME